MAYGTHLTKEKKRFRRTSRNLLISSTILLVSTVISAFFLYRETGALEESVQISETIVNANVRTLTQAQRETLKLIILLERGENDPEVLELQRAFVTQRFRESTLSYQLFTLGTEALLARAQTAANNWTNEVDPLIQEIIADANDDDRVLRNIAITKLRELELEFNDLVAQGEINRKQQAGKANTAVQRTLQSARWLLLGLGLTLAGFIGFVYYTIHAYRQFDQQRESHAAELMTLNAEMHKLSQVASRTENLVIVSDNLGRIEWVNEAFVSLTGYTLDEVQGRTPGSFLQGKDSDPDTISYMGDQLRQGLGFSTELINYDKSGHPYWVSLEVQPSYNEAGSLQHFIAIESDITERKAAEKKLTTYAQNLENETALHLEQRQRLSSLLEIVTKHESVDAQLQEIVKRGAQALKMDAGLISRIDERYHIMTAYAPTLPIETGLSCDLKATLCAQTVVSTRVFSTIGIRPVDIDAPCFEGVYPAAYIGMRIVVNGRSFGTLSFLGMGPRQPFTESDHDFVHLMVQWVNVALERQQTQQALSDYAADLGERNKELQEFAYIASHDLQEPLRKIQTFGSRLSGKYADVLDERGVDYLDRMQNAAARMQMLISDLLAFSRVSTHTIPFAAVDLNNVVLEVLTDLEVRVERTAAEIEIDHLPIIEADATQMRQLFQNLISNALKFADLERPLTIKLTTRTIRPGPLTDKFVEIKIKDNGIGFEQQFAERIFQVFQRLHGKTSYEGSGIGLAICKKIIERHNGSIEASGSLGEGATFTIQLPLKQP